MANTSNGSTSVPALVERLESRELLSAETPLRDAIAAESTLPPHLLDVYVSGSSWSQDVFEYLDRHRLGNGPHGFRIPTSYSTGVGWINVNQITVRLTHEMVVEADDLRVRGVARPTYDVASVQTSFDRFNTTATFTLAGAGFDQAESLLIELDGDPGGVHVRGGETLLDGDRDGVPGGDFVFRMSVVPGDVTGGANVTYTDLRVVRNVLGRTALNRGTDAPFYSPFADLDADGRVNVIDLVHVRRRLFTYAPTGTPAPAAPAGVTADLRTRPAARGLFSFTPVLDG